MLKLLRNKGIQKRIFIGLAFFIILSFAVSGIIINQDGAKDQNALAKFEKRQFRVQDYLDSYRAVQRQAGFMYGDKLNDIRSRIDFKGEAWDRLLLLEHAKTEKIKVSDNEVVKWVVSQEAFKKDGKFDESYYKMMIERGMRTTPRQFEEEIRQMLTLGKVVESLKNKATVNDEELKKLYLEERTEKDIVYGLLTSDQVADKVQVKEEDVRALFETLKDQLSMPPRAKVQYLLIPSSSTETIKTILADESTPFDDLSKKYNLESKESPLFSAKDPVAELSAVPDALSFALSAESGAVSQWLDSPKGKYRVKVLTKEAERPLTYEEAKVEVSKKIKEQDASKYALETLKSVREKIKEPGDFEKILKENQIELTPIPLYKKGTYPAGIWPSENMAVAVAPLKDNEMSDAFEVPKGAMVVKVNKVYAADEKKFEEEKQTFREKIESNKSQEAMQKLLEGLRDKLSINLELMKEIFPAE